MLGWIQKVVPQPPLSPSVLVMVKNDTQVGAKLEARPLAEGTPGCPAKGCNAESVSGSHDPGSATESVGHGVLTWISQGLEKVMPQPAQSPPHMLQMAERSFEGSIDVPDVTEVQSILEELEEEDPELDIIVLKPEEDNSVLQSSSDNNAQEKSGGKKVLTWLMEEFGKMIPQPEHLKKHEEGTSEDQVAEQVGSHRLDGSRSHGGNFQASPSSMSGAKHGAPSALAPQTPGGNGSSLFERFVQGLEKVIPQPVNHAKQGNQSAEVAGVCPGQERSKGS